MFCVAWWVVTNVVKELTAFIFMEETLPLIKNTFLENFVGILFGKKNPLF